MTDVTSTDAIVGYHAHVYYDADDKPVAAELREALAEQFDSAIVLGRWHDTPIGPHPTGSYQIAFKPDLFARIVPWLALNRAGLTVFVHPDTGNVIADHSAYVIWLGDSRTLNMDGLR